MSSSRRRQQQLFPIREKETFWFGGGIRWLGSVCLPRGEANTIDLERNENTPADNKKRRMDAVRAMAEALQSVEWKRPVEEAALEIEMDWTLERDSDPRQISVSECAFLNTHRWVISALPFNICENVVEVVNLYREHFSDYIPLLQKERLPSAKYVFQPQLGTDAGVTEENRPDVIALLDVLFRFPDHINCFIYSEVDHQIMYSWKGYDFPPEYSRAEIIDFVQNGNEVLDPTLCYWCENSKLTCGKTLSLCSKCRSLSYCSRDCQVNDWKAFHKKECKEIVASGNRNPDYLKLTRMDTLAAHGAQRLTFPMEIADSGVWRGDLLLIYLISPTGGVRLDNETLAFPRGFRIEAREVTAYKKRRAAAGGASTK